MSQWEQPRLEILLITMQSAYRVVVLHTDLFPSICTIPTYYILVANKVYMHTDQKKDGK